MSSIDEQIDKAREAYREETAKTADAIHLDAVYARLQQELEPRSRRWLWLIAPSLVAMLVVIIWATTRPSTRGLTAEVIMHDGTVVRSHGGELTSVLSAETVQIANGAELEIAFRDDVRVAFRGPADFSLEGAQLTVVAGRARFAVRSRAGRAPYRMRAGDTDVLVHGTDFTLHVEEGTLACLRVSEGVVELDGNAQHLTVRAGESHCPAAHGDDDPITWHEHPPWQPPPAAIDEPTTLDDEQLVPSEERPTSESRARPSANDVLGRIRKSRSAGQCGRVAELVAELHGRAAEHEGAALLELAECHIETGAPKRALEVYTRIVAEMPQKSSVAETALFEQARIASELGRREDALALTDTYLARYSEGRLAAQAMFRRCELLIGFERLVPARACLETFRAQHASDSRASDALLLLATLARAQSRWAEAAELYRNYVALGEMPRREEAMYQLAKSLSRGKLPGAPEAIQRYIEYYPEGRYTAEIRAMTP